MPAPPITPILDPMDWEGFGDRLKRLRIGRALSRDALGRLTGITGQTIYDLERGKTKLPQPETLRTLAEALGSDEVYLLTGKHPVPEGQEWRPDHLAVALRHTTRLEEADIQQIIRIVRSLEREQLASE